ncbi:MAG TPA: prolipoprotein diacylglyceryl transferase family protein [Phycisphaerae bacterium]|nr:prolipoprotein diacylglyceryl transferase family protein [Phycisphaerae bacterium]
MQRIIVDFGVLKLFGGEIPLRIYGYGLMLVVGFLSGIWLAQWRARRCGESADAVAVCGILALLGGVVGARLAYVVENFSEFANAPNPLAAVLDVTSGGLIYYGGVLGALGAILTYLRIKRLSIRRYLDIFAVSFVVGLAFGRAGCFVNGCCYGARCSDSWPLHARFPMYSQPLVKLDGSPGPFSVGMDSPSPVFAHQWQTDADFHRQVDERLVRRLPAAARLPDGPASNPRPPRFLHGKLDGDQLAVMMGAEADARAKFARLTGGGAYLTAETWRRGLSEPNGLLRGSEGWDEALVYALQGRHGQLSFEEFWAYQQHRKSRLLARFDADGDGALRGDERLAANAYLQEDLFALAARCKSLPVKPAQIVGMINALMLAGLLWAFFRLRTREGQVFALLLVLYPITRFVLEGIRADNAHNLWSFEFTHNQVSSIVIILLGLAMWLGLRKLPAWAGPPSPKRRADRNTRGSC